MKITKEKDKSNNKTYWMAKGIINKKSYCFVINYNNTTESEFNKMAKNAFNIEKQKSDKNLMLNKLEDNIIYEYEFSNVWDSDQNKKDYEINKLIGYKNGPIFKLVKYYFDSYDKGFFGFGAGDTTHLIYDVQPQMDMAKMFGHINYKTAQKSNLRIHRTKYIKALAYHDPSVHNIK